MPDAAGHFGVFGGRFVPEALIAALDELAAAYAAARVDPEFLAELDRLARTYTGRPTPLTEVPRFAAAGGAQRGSCSSARTSTTPARTRSTTSWARPCSPCGWASGG